MNVCLGYLERRKSDLRLVDLTYLLWKEQPSDVKICMILMMNQKNHI